ncbi:MAG: KEOPS complex subunit Cgi121 [Candidatus Micrarchaeia archaeon]
MNPKIERLLNDDRIIIKKCETLPESRLNELIKKAKELSSKKEFLQLFDARSILNRKHLIFAYANAVISTIEKRGKANSVRVEMMRFAALTNQISTAIQICGAKDGPFIIFSNSIQAYNSIKKDLSNPVDFEGENKQAYKLLKVKDFDSLAEKMSLLNLSD